MKARNSTVSQIILQSIVAIVTIVMLGGMTALFVQGGSGVLEQSFESTKDILTSLAS